jgi:hypothetical protein
MTTPQDIQEALDAFKMINRGPAESPNENEIMFNGFLFEKEVRIIEQILQSHAPTPNVALNEAVQAIGRQSKNKKFHSEVIGDLTILKEASPVDIEQLKKDCLGGMGNTDGPFFEMCEDKVNIHPERIVDKAVQWTVDELLRRGFRQGGGS